jgi:hypothetical protein
MILKRLGIVNRKKTALNSLLRQKEHFLEKKTEAGSLHFHASVFDFIRSIKRLFVLFLFRLICNDRLSCDKQ